MMNFSNEDLLALLHNGDDHSFEKLFHGVYSSLKDLSSYIVKNEQEAEDIVSKSITRLWQMVTKGKIPEKPKSFLVTIVKNASIDSIRDLKKRAKAEALFCLLLDKHQSSSMPKNISELLADEEIYWELTKDELANNLKKKVLLLPPKQRAIISLSYYEGLTNKEIAAILDVTVKTVEKQKSSAVKTIKKHYKSW